MPLQLPASRFSRNRLDREYQTVSAMIHLYCRARHGRQVELCQECQGLLDYARVRLDRCRFGIEKPTCARCPVHCYKPDRREQIRIVMRAAGPHMVWRHPILSLRHWLDGFRKVPTTNRRHDLGKPGHPCDCRHEEQPGLLQSELASHSQKP